LTGSAAALYAGPAIILSYVLAGTACVFAGLCYAEFASMIPIAGSAYYLRLFDARRDRCLDIGWDLILEYAFGAANRRQRLEQYPCGVSAGLWNSLPPQICDVPGADGRSSMADGDLRVRLVYRWLN